MIDRIVARVRTAAKAIVALAAPILSALLVDVVADLQAEAEIGIAAAVTAALVYLVPNKTE